MVKRPGGRGATPGDGDPGGCRIIIDPEFRVGEVDPRLFGSFIEHLGRAVYTGIYEPDHPDADDQGFRRDVLGLVRQLGVPIVRYPGGNFVSAYDWLDGVGPRDARPKRLDLAWHTLETNQVGTDDFCEWARRAGTEVMMAANLGTAGVDSARNLVEYCNHPGGSRYSDLRIANGRTEPHAIKTWCLGNEMDGPWQVGHKNAAEYGALASNAAKAMKAVDRTIELIACGSSGAQMSTYGTWETTVLDHCYDDVDYLSLHTYFFPSSDDPGSFLAQNVEMDDFIRSVASMCDTVRARKRSKKRVHLSFDEWNVWRMTDGDFAVMGGEDWPEAPPLYEQPYTLEDAVAVGLMAITLLRNADRVKIGCLAQLVNTIAPITTVAGGPAHRQTIFYPYLHVSRYGRGTALDVQVRSPHYECAKFGAVPLLDAVAVNDEEHDSLTLFAVNRSIGAMLPVEGDVRGVPGYQVLEHLVLEHEDRLAQNTAEHPDTVVPHRLGDAALAGGRLTASLPPLSWNVIRMARG